MSTSHLLDFPAKDARVLEQRTVCAEHHLATLPLFDDENLIKLLDRHPAEVLHIHTMGTDKSRNQWREGRASRLSGAQLLEATRQGRLWLNVRELYKFQPEYRRLIDELYTEIESRCRGLKTFERTATLLISSPSAQVYYHLDVPINILWHLRGKKRVWVYPLSDPRFVSPEHLEAIVSNEMGEELPFDEAFDQQAEVYDLKPGQMITWPQNTPHRVENLEGLNVSLSTEYMTRAAASRLRVYRANRFLRQHITPRNWSTKTSGPGYLLKMATYAGVRACRKLRPQVDRGFTYPLSFNVDSPSGELIETAAESELSAVGIPASPDAAPVPDSPTSV